MKETIQFRPRKNFQIKASQVRLINSDGANLGVMPLGEAVSKAREQGMDVIEINGKTYPVVAKIGDLGRMMYESKKQQSETKKKQQVHLIKHLACHITTEEHDLLRQVNQAKEFLAEGHKVIFTIKLRGRELQHSNLAYDKLLWVIENLKACISEYTRPTLEGKNMVVSFSPAKK